MLGPGQQTNAKVFSKVLAFIIKWLTPEFLFLFVGDHILATSFLGLPLGLLGSSAADGALVLLGAIKLLR